MVPVSTWERGRLWPRRIQVTMRGQGRRDDVVQESALFIERFNGGAHQLHHACSFTCWLKKQAAKELIYCVTLLPRCTPITTRSSFYSLSFLAMASRALLILLSRPKCPLHLRQGQAAIGKLQLVNPHLGLFEKGHLNHVLGECCG